MKLLYLTKYDNLGASSRYRSIQYFKYLEKEGVEVVHKPLFSNKYLLYKYNQNKYFILLLIIAYIRRAIFLIFFSSKGISYVIIEKEIFPYLPIKEGSLMKRLRFNYILDYDDAIWHNYDKYSLFKKMMYSKLANLSNKSNIAIGGSHYIIDYLHKLGARKVVFIPTVIDFEKYNCNFEKLKGKYVVGWIGSPGTSKYILKMNKVLESFCLYSNGIVHLIGFDKLIAKKLTFPYKIIPWDRDTEVKEISKFSLGIMPLSKEPFSKGKCGFKLIQYMACGIPVVASGIGENNFIVKDNINGFTVNSQNEWKMIMEKLFKDRELGDQLGMKGRELVKNFYSLQVQLPILMKVLKNDLTSGVNL